MGHGPSVSLRYACHADPHAPDEVMAGGDDGRLPCRLHSHGRHRWKCAPPPPRALSLQRRKESKCTQEPTASTRGGSVWPDRARSSCKLGA
jgi:hypothetical protein